MPRPSRDLKVLRQEWEEAWGAQDRAWETARDVCQCEKPCRGPTYLHVTRCSICKGVIIET